MKDRVSQSPGRVLITPEDGGAPFYAVMARADQPVEPGTALNKANLLSDSTAAALGLSGDSTVNDAFARLNGKVNSVETRVTPVQYGGTGMSSFTANRLIYPSAATTLSQLAFPSVAGSVLRQGTSGAPYWSSTASLFVTVSSTVTYTANATTVTISNGNITASALVFLSINPSSDANCKMIAGLNLYFKSQANGSITLGVASPSSSSDGIPYTLAIWK